MTLSISPASIWGKAWPILFAILFFGAIIAFHEMGHFFTAKLFGIRVNEFSIGMGPVLLKRKKGDTQYSWRLLPVGGFVAMEGENEASEDPRAFGNQKAWKRFIVIAAGATVNILFGLLLVCLMLGMDGNLPTATVSEVSQHMLDTGTVLVGDEIREINGVGVTSARDLYYSLYRDKDGVYDLVIKRDGEKIEYTDAELYYNSEEGLCDFIVGYKDVTFLNLLPGAVKETASMTKLIFLSFVDMLSGEYGMKDISGPVGTINIVAETTSNAVAGADYASIIFILAFITVNIGIVNLMPLPALDGGHLFFIFVEIITRKAVPKKFEAMVHAIGLALLLAFMAVITCSDVYHLIKG